MYSLVSPAQFFTAKSHHAHFTVANHPYSIRVPFLRSTLNSDSFFPRTAILLTRLPRGCFPKHNNPPLQVQRQPLPILHILIIWTSGFFPTPLQQTHLVTLYHECLTTGPCIGWTKVKNNVRALVLEVFFQMSLTKC